MNFVTKNLIDELKDLIILKEFFESDAYMSDNKPLITGYLDSEIKQHVQDIIHTERL